jgi:uncharacterized protein (TIGR01777 family)
MNILVSGSSGFIGSALVPFLKTGGHQVTRLARTAGGSDGKAVAWDPAAGRIDAAALEGFDVAIHLAGESLASGRWNAKKKARIRDSRAKGTRLLAETLARLARPPQVFASAAAVGFYGPRGDEVLDEDSAPGTGFLADVCRAWEQATEPAAQTGIRVVNLRFGVVLGSHGGALRQMLTPFKLGMGGVIGSGKQYMSWIALDDAVGAVLHTVSTDALRGPVNVVAPQPVTNYAFTKTLGKVLGRPTLIPMPAFLARLAFGEMADELLLSGQRVVPKRLSETGYAFSCPDLESALRHLLGKKPAISDLYSR